MCARTTTTPSMPRWRASSLYRGGVVYSTTSGTVTVEASIADDARRTSRTAVAGALDDADTAASSAFGRLAVRTSIYAMTSGAASAANGSPTNAVIPTTAKVVLRPAAQRFRETVTSDAIRAARSDVRAMATVAAGAATRDDRTMSRRSTA